MAEFAVFRPAARARVRRSPAGRTARGSSAATPVERLFLRWDLENEEAQAHVERRLRRMGVIAALERAGFEPGDDVEIGGTVFELDPSRRLGAGARRRRQARVVDRRRGHRRAAAVRGRARSARRSRRCTAPASTSSSSPRARSRAGSTCSGCRCGRGRSRSCRRRRAVGQGRLYRTYDEYLRERGIQSAQVLLTFFDMSARTHYLNARRTLRKLLDWRIVPVINENDTTTTDEISFGDNDFLAAQVAVLVDASLLLLLTSTPRAVHGRPALRPVARLVATVADPAELEALRIGERRRRWARAGCARRSWPPRWRPRRGSRRSSAAGFEPGVLARAWAGEAVGHALRAAPGPPARRFKLWLKYAKPSQGAVVVDAGAARALRDGGTSLLPVGIVRRRGRVRGAATRSRSRASGRGGQGDLELLRRRAAAGDGHEVRRRSARCCRGRRKRPCTGTTSC